MPSRRSGAVLTVTLLRGRVDDRMVAERSSATVPAPPDFGGRAPEDAEPPRPKRSWLQGDTHGVAQSFIVEICANAIAGLARYRPRDLVPTDGPARARPAEDPGGGSSTSPVQHFFRGSPGRPPGRGRLSSVSVSRSVSARSTPPRRGVRRAAETREREPTAAGRPAPRRT